MSDLIDKASRQIGCPINISQDSAAAVCNSWQREWEQAVVIGDSNTDMLFSGEIEFRLRKIVPVTRLHFPAGECSKNRRTKEMLEDAMLKARIRRSACIVAVGGGVVLDLAGFTAATYMRGIDHINVATTLLAQIDAAIGGKTGVNADFGKNLIGAFHRPKVIVIDLKSLRTLPAVELTHGVAELVKHAVIGDRVLFQEMASAGAGLAQLIPDVLFRAIAVKAAVVEADEKEQGMRRILNFGHTIGHAIEQAANYHLHHGAAVSVGMMVEALLASRVCGFPAEEVRQLRTLLKSAGLPIVPPCDFAAIKPFLKNDKKNSGADICFSLPLAIGQMDEADGQWVRPVDCDAVMDAYKSTVAFERKQND